MSLDDFITKKKISYPSKRGRGTGPRRGGGGGPMKSQPQRNNSSFSRGGMRNGGPARNGGSVPAGRWGHDMFANGGKSRPQPLMSGGGGGFSGPSGPVKLMVTNLDYKVTDSDIRELFGEFGSMQSASIHFDSSGCSLGSAQILYSNKACAIRAKQQYNGVHLDGRPMNIAIEGDGSQGAGRPTSLMGGRPMSGTRIGGGAPRSMGASRGFSRGVGASRGGASRGAGRGRGGRGGNRSSDAKPKSAEELDKELESYLEEAKKK